jgi:hypothetical protein
MHHEWYPTQVALLDRRGRLVREYWHSGVLAQLKFADLDHNGRPEIYAAGVNNAAGQATLVKLDPDTIGGASQEPDTYQLEGFAVGREVARFLFPRSCLTRVMAKYNIAHNLRATSDGLTVQVDQAAYSGEEPVITYELTPALTVRTMGITDTYLVLHQQRELQLGHTFNAAEEHTLRQLHHAP